MTWSLWAVITAILYGLFDFFVKKTAGKVDDSTAALIFNVVATIVLVVYVLIDRLSGSKTYITNEGLTYNIIGGLLIGLASITFIKVFSTGSNLSVGVAIVRVGMVVLAAFLGLFILKDKLDLRQLLGLATAVVGLALLLIK